MYQCSLAIYPLPIALSYLAECLRVNGKFYDAYSYLRKARVIMSEKLGEENTETQEGDNAIDYATDLWWTYTVFVDSESVSYVVAILLSIVIHAAFSCVEISTKW